MRIALPLAACLLGMLLVDGIDIVHGVALGIATYLAHAVVAMLLTRGLSSDDRIVLALAQQNGITAMVLSLLLEVQHPGIVATVAPAILTVNILHAVANAANQKRQGRAKALLAA